VARRAMLDAAIEELSSDTDEAAKAVKHEYEVSRAAGMGAAGADASAAAYDRLRLRAIAAERRVLTEWRKQGRMFDDAYHLLEEELDRAELHAAWLGADPAEAEPFEG